ncbi:MAG: transposase [bacterium LCO1.1]|uniref:Transposase n=1 Tax=Candidatus Weimeria bifida TaxID=2599074 RepID=A0A6N7IY97_9FIRM|nr:transposase [Candidatus Weimeria bifida]
MEYEASRCIELCQESGNYLKTFLDHPEVPLDKHDAERSIRKFCVGKHNWHIIDSVNGASASALYYSIAETAKANGLKP